MTREEVIAVLKANEAELRRQGVTHAAVFGSRARGDHRPDSDIDVLVDIDPDARIGIWGYAGVVDYIRALFSHPVDVAQRAGLRAHVRPSAEREAIYAF